MTDPRRWPEAYPGLKPLTKEAIDNLVCSVADLIDYFVENAGVPGPVRSGEPKDQSGGTAAGDRDQGGSNDPNQLLTPAKLAEPPAADANGPVPPDGFVFDGRRFYGLARQPFRALQYLWTQPSMAATKEDLAGPVFDDSEELVVVSQLHNIRRDLNGFFRSHSLPFHSTVTNGYLAVKQGAPSRRRAKSKKKTTRRPSRR